MGIVSHFQPHLLHLVTAFPCTLGPSDEAGEEPPTISFIISDVCLVLYTLELHLVWLCQGPLETGNASFFLDFALWKGWYSQLNLSLMTLMCVSETLRKLSSCVPRYIHHLGRLSRNIRFLQIIWDITHEVFCWIRKCVSLKTGLKPILESINHKNFYLTVFHMASVCNTWWNCPAKYLQKHKSVDVFWFPAIWIYIYSPWRFVRFHFPILTICVLYGWIFIGQGAGSVIRDNDPGVILFPTTVLLLLMEIRQTTWDV